MEITYIGRLVRETKRDKIMEAQVETGAFAASVEATNRQIGRFIQLPESIGKSIDVYRKSKSQDRNVSKKVRTMYNFSKELLPEFDEKIEEWVEHLKEEDIGQIKVSNVIEEMEKKHRETNTLLTKVEQGIMLEEKSPTIYYMAKKHYHMANLFLEQLRNHKDNIDLDQAVRQIEESEEKLKLYKLGTFISLEPMLVSSLVLAGIREDDEFIDRYSELLDQYSFMFSRLFREVYRQETGLTKIKMDKSQVDSFVAAKGF